MLPKLPVSMQMPAIKQVPSRRRRRCWDVLRWRFIGRFIRTLRNVKYPTVCVYRSQNKWLTMCEQGICGQPKTEHCKTQVPPGVSADA